MGKHTHMPNMSLSIKNDLWDTHRKRLSLRSNQCSWRKRWDGMLDCTKTCWPCQVHTISSAECNAWIRRRVTPQAILSDGVQICYCDNMRGLWVHTLVSKTPTALARMAPPMTPFNPREKKEKLSKIHNTNRANHDLKHYWLFSSVDVSNVLIPDRSIPVPWLWPHILSLPPNALIREHFHSQLSYPQLDCSSTTQVGWGGQLICADTSNQCLITDSSLPIQCAWRTNSW